MILERISAPVDIVTTGDVKGFMRVQHAHEDTLIEDLTRAAVSYVETVTGRFFGVGSTFEIRMPGFGAVPLLPKTTAVTSVAYFDPDGQVQTLPDGWRVEFGAVPCLTFQDAPPLVQPRADAVTVRFVAGEVPSDAIKKAVMSLVHHWYDERGPESLAARRSPDLAGIPARVRWLLSPERRVGL